MTVSKKIKTDNKTSKEGYFPERLVKLLILLIFIFKQKILIDFMKIKKLTILPAIWIAKMHTSQI